MSRDPRKVWRYYAEALVQEEDPKKINFLMQKLFEALSENEEESKLYLARLKHEQSE